MIPFVSNMKWVQANYRETQLTNVKVADPADVRIDEYPEKSSTEESSRLPRQAVRNSRSSLLTTLQAISQKWCNEWR